MAHSALFAGVGGSPYRCPGSQVSVLKPLIQPSPGTPVPPPGCSSSPGAVRVRHALWPARDDGLSGASGSAFVFSSVGVDTERAYWDTPFIVLPKILVHPLSPCIRACPVLFAKQDFALSPSSDVTDGYSIFRFQTGKHHTYIQVGFSCYCPSDMGSKRPNKCFTIFLTHFSGK